MEAEESSRPRHGGRPRSTAAIATIGGIVLIALALYLGRSPILSFIAGRGLSLATGYDVRIGGTSLGREHGAITDVHVTKSGDPVLDAKRIDLSYQLRDVFPGGDHRFGFVSAAVDGAVLTIVRHSDGTFNFNRGASTSTVPSSTKHAGAPLFFDLRLRDGTIRIIDLAAHDALSKRQAIEDVSIDASVKSDQRTHYVMHGDYVATRGAGFPTRTYPVGAQGTIDYAHRYALHRLRAPQLPIRAALNFVVNTAGVRAQDGLLHDLDVTAYALNIKPDTTLAYHLGGGARLTDGVLSLAAFAVPIRNVRGAIHLYDDGIATPRADATLAGVPVAAEGAIYGFTQPAFRLGVTGRGDARDLRRIFAFATRQPVSGEVHVATLLESAVDAPLIVVGVDAPALRYDRFPLTATTGSIAYYDAAAFLAPVVAHLGAATIDVGGRILLGGREPQTRLAVRVSGDASSLPYAGLIAPHSAVEAFALLDGTGLRIGARGALSAAGATGANGFFSIDPNGTVGVGPVVVDRGPAGSFFGGVRYVRRTNAAALWLQARNFAVDTTARMPAIPGLALPALPAATGTLDGDIAGAGTLAAFDLAGHLAVRDAHALGYGIDDAALDVAGDASDLSIANLAVHSPLGSFTGGGQYAGGTLQLAGDLRGAFDRIPQAAAAGLHGTIASPVALSIGTERTVVQLQGARFSGADVRGVALGSADGTVALEHGRIAAVTAQATLGGRAAAVTGNGDRVGVSTSGLDVRALRGTGVPLAAGSLTILGVANLGAVPSFDGGVGLENGRYGTFDVGGTAELGYRGTQLRIDRGLLSLGRTYSAFDGTVADATSSAPSYDLKAQMLGADISSLGASVGTPIRNLDGTVDATVRLRGTGRHPVINGTIRVPEGVDNGLAFSDASAELEGDLGGGRVSNGHITVGSTSAAFAGAMRGTAVRFDLRSDRADLADFNDYFDEADTLGGRGRLAVAFSADGRTTTTHGAVDIANLRYHRFELGSTVAAWSPGPSGLRTSLAIGGSAGRLTAGGVIALGRGPARSAFDRARYDLTAHIRGLDLKTWLPAFNVNEPVLGYVDADARAVGRYPALTITSQASVAGGRVGPTRIESLHVSTTSVGRTTRIRSAELVLPFATVTADGSFSADRSAPLALGLHANIPDLMAVAKAYQSYPPAIGGSLESDVAIRGSIDRPRVSGGFDLENARYEAFALPRAIGSVGLAGREVVLRDAELIFNRGSAFVAGSVPFTLQPFRVGPRSAALGFDVDARGVDLGQFSALFPRGTQIGGIVNGHFGVGGTVAAPELFGGLGLANGSFAGPAETQPLRNITANLALRSRSITLEALHADAGPGSLDASGRVDLAGSNRLAYGFDLRAANARLNLPSYGSGTLDANVRLETTPTIPRLSGDIALTSTVIPFSAITNLAANAAPFGSNADAGAPPPVPGPSNVAFDLSIDAQKDVRLRGSLVPSTNLDVGGTGTLVLTGTLHDPHLDGVITASNGGTLTDFNRVFRVASGTVTFDPSAGVIPDLNIEATAHVQNPDPDPARNAAGTADVTIGITGPATSPRVVYSSNPPYATEQIVGLLLDAPLLGAENFNRSTGQPGTLKGAPGESNVELPPTILPENGGSIDFSQEAFSVFNAQVAQRFLGPTERLLSDAVGLSELDFNIDNAGDIGMNAQKQIAHKPLYASYGRSLDGPEHDNIGLESRPDDVTSLQLNIFKTAQQSILTGLSPTGPSVAANGRRVTPGEPLSGTGGFTFNVVRRFW